MNKYFYSEKSKAIFRMRPNDNGTHDVSMVAENLASHEDGYLLASADRFKDISEKYDKLVDWVIEYVNLKALPEEFQSIKNDSNQVKMLLLNLRESGGDK